MLTVKIRHSNLQKGKTLNFKSFNLYYYIFKMRLVQLFGVTLFCSKFSLCWMVERAGPPIQPFFSLSNVLPENSPAGKRAMANSQCIYLLVIINVKHKKKQKNRNPLFLCCCFLLYLSTKFRFNLFLWTVKLNLGKQIRVFNNYCSIQCRKLKWNGCTLVKINMLTVFKPFYAWGYSIPNHNFFSSTWLSSILCGPT